MERWSEIAPHVLEECIAQKKKQFKELFDRVADKNDTKSICIITLLTLSQHVSIPNYVKDKKILRPTKLEAQSLFFDIVEVSKFSKSVKNLTPLQLKIIGKCVSPT